MSVYDGEFMRGDGIREELRLNNGTLSFLDDHLGRLFEAALFTDLDIGKTREELKAAIEATLQAKNMHTDVHVGLMVTRGKKRKPFQLPHLSIFGLALVVIAKHSKPSTVAVENEIRFHTVPHHRG